MNLLKKISSIKMQLFGIAVLMCTMWDISDVFAGSIGHVNPFYIGISIALTLVTIVYFLWAVDVWKEAVAAEYPILTVQGGEQDWDAEIVDNGLGSTISLTRKGADALLPVGTKLYVMKGK